MTANNAIRWKTYTVRESVVGADVFSHDIKVFESKKSSKYFKYAPDISMTFLDVSSLVALLYMFHGAKTKYSFVVVFPLFLSSFISVTVKFLRLFYVKPFLNDLRSDLVKDDCYWQDNGDFYFSY